GVPGVLLGKDARDILGRWAEGGAPTTHASILAMFLVNGHSIHMLNIVKLRNENRCAAWLVRAFGCTRPGRGFTGGCGGGAGSAGRRGGGPRGRRRAGRRGRRSTPPGRAGR